LVVGRWTSILYFSIRLCVLTGSTPTFFGLQVLPPSAHGERHASFWQRRRGGRPSAAVSIIRPRANRVMSAELPAVRGSGLVHGSLVRCWWSVVRGSSLRMRKKKGPRADWHVSAGRPFGYAALVIQGPTLRLIPSGCSWHRSRLVNACQSTFLARWNPGANRAKRWRAPRARRGWPRTGRPHFGRATGALRLSGRNGMSGSNRTTRRVPAGQGA
jgi:hypothetical protein